MKQRGWLGGDWSTIPERMLVDGKRPWMVGVAVSLVSSAIIETPGPGCLEVGVFFLALGGGANDTKWLKHSSKSQHLFHINCRGPFDWMPKLSLAESNMVPKNTKTL